MQIATGTVVDGKVVINGNPLPDGMTVTILVREADETFDVPPELESDLEQSIAEADAGASISVEQALERLRHIA